MVSAVVQSTPDRADGSGMFALRMRVLPLCCCIALLVVPAAVSARQTVPYAPSEQRSFNAVLTEWAPIARTPGGTGVFTLQPRSFYRLQPQRLLVLAARDVDGHRWLDVRLPAWFSHGMTSGWLDARHVKLSINRWRVEVSRETGILRILHGGQVVRSAHVGTGTSSTPTPRGLNATYDHWRSTESVLGEWTVSLTTRSPEVPNMDGQQAVVAIHGWHAGGGATGSVSHGCVRVADDSLMRMLALELPAGTPVNVS
jgi:L,D-transpeptidase-like protein